MMDEGAIFITLQFPRILEKKGIGQKLVTSSLAALKNEGINKVALVVFSNNNLGNLFWEKLGFKKREDLIYRDKAINEMKKITV